VFKIKYKIISSLTQHKIELETDKTVYFSYDCKIAFIHFYGDTTTIALKEAYFNLDTRNDNMFIEPRGELVE